LRRSQTKEPTRWLANLNGRFGAWPLESENANSSSSPGNCLSRLLWSRGYVEHRQVLAAQHESVVLQTILIMLARHQNNNAWFSSIQPRKVLNGLSSKRFSIHLIAGQVVSAEILMASEQGCPIEMHRIGIEKCDEMYDPDCKGDTFMPFHRAQYDKNTGQSPNSPREQVTCL